MITTENYTGADLSGSNGDANRVLTLNNSAKTLSDGFEVYVDGLLQTLTTDYTVVHNAAGSTVTLIDNTYNDTPIVVNYYTLGDDSDPTAPYTESFLGSALSGSDGDANRVATLTNTNITISDGFEVYVEGLLKTLNTDYTISHSVPSTVTFLIPIYDTDSIVVNYYTTLTPSASTAGKLPLDARFIQKNIGALGDICTVTEIAVSFGSDEYRTKTEAETDHTNIPCYVHILSYEDEIVKQGDARAGDLKFWFDASYEALFTPSGDDKVRISFNNDTYEVKNIMPFKAVGNTLMLIEVLVAQI
jgi:hypothetical protein